MKLNPKQLINVFIVFGERTVGEDACCDNLSTTADLRLQASVSASLTRKPDGTKEVDWCAFLMFSKNNAFVEWFATAFGHCRLLQRLFHFSVCQKLCNQQQNIAGEDTCFPGGSQKRMTIVVDGCRLLGLRVTPSSAVPVCQRHSPETALQLVSGSRLDLAWFGLSYLRGQGIIEVYHTVKEHWEVSYYFFNHFGKGRHLKSKMFTWALL